MVNAVAFLDVNIISTENKVGHYSNIFTIKFVFSERERLFKRWEKAMERARHWTSD
jgi:hypothetical protein